MGCSKSRPQNKDQAQQITGVENPDVRNHNVIVNNKLFNQDILVTKGMKSGGQLGRTGDGDLEVGFQVMFQKRKIKKYIVASNVPQNTETSIVS